MNFASEMKINAHNDMSVWAAMRYVEIHSNGSGKLLIGLPEMNIECYKLVSNTSIVNPVYLLIQDFTKCFPTSSFAIDVFYNKEDMIAMVKDLLSNL